MSAPSQEALADCIARIEAADLELVRFVWCDTHGQTRGKMLTRQAAIKALAGGVGMVSTLMLKDSSDRLQGV